MGDIAEMHVEAYQAGLDPNDMDGADWADFYGGEDDDIRSLEDIAEDFASSVRIFPMTDLLDAAFDGETPDTTLRRLFPKLTEGQAKGFFAVVEAIGGFPGDTP